MRYMIMVDGEQPVFANSVREASQLVCDHEETQKRIGKEIEKLEFGAILNCEMATYIVAVHNTLIPFK